MTVPAGAKLALMGRNGAGKSTMIGLLAGTVSPNSGHIHRVGTMSWPMGFSGSFASDITGRQNALFVARIYGVDPVALLDFVQDFSELGGFFDMPVRSYSSGMRARLAFGLSIGLGFDWYLVDEVTAVGDTSFRQKALEEFQTRLADAGLIMVSHSTKTLRDYCTSGIVLEAGECVYYPDLEEAIRQHEMNMDVAFIDEAAAEGAEVLYREAKRQFQNRDYARAEELLLRANADPAATADWHALLGEVNRRMGAPEPAIDAYRRALTLEKEPRYRVAIAQLLASLGRLDDAEIEYSAVLEAEPDDLAANYGLGRLRFRQGAIDEAQTLLSKVLEGDPDNAGAHRAMALMFDARRDNAMALRHHLEVARLLPDNATFLIGLARSQTRNADSVGAAATWGRVLALDPENAEARKGLEKTIWRS